MGDPMDDCSLCHQPALEGQDLASNNDHVVCKNEWAQRRENDLCVMCGDKAHGRMACPSCIANNNGHFSGYSGPV